MQKIALTWYSLLSIVLFILYGLDKAQAVASGRRIPERVLHSLALAGGFAGGLLGRIIFHHKTRKPYFLILLLVSAAIHVILWLVVFTH
jgi:uncharacterized membrane protein YsdA (DUF1294 family)